MINHLGDHEVDPRDPRIKQQKKLDIHNRTAGEMIRQMYELGDFDDFDVDYNFTTYSSSTTVSRGTWEVT